ncbi:MAG TPA: hypothetical protein VND93_31490, partial [Myxococcales bacterium]|nr:hypothetical protein [Myxococcales bacterium]
SKLPEVKVGDVLLAVGSRTVYALDAVARIAAEESVRPPPGGLQLSIERSGEAKTVKLSKPGKAPPGKAGE